ncbi:tRNA synthetases class I-domain-containing protein [Schizophyllum amplum]|uniref:Isoleucine--tRNA ligase, mitochondrial n=1 Tax=Schizophyllum amplum TaxID=97359 RepID=A0A550BYC2_9AGAR|nr:tRNA synthetases class I-domain-containing protein [Auriculariopsis ampla]
MLLVRPSCRGVLRRRLRLTAKQSSTVAPSDNKAYSKTLLLPKTSFPLWIDPAKSEAPFRERTSDALYRSQWEHASGRLFVLHDGPPYANGHLHIGHALNKILKDIISRFHVTQGRRVHYVPGWDCHGLPIEQKTLQEMKKDAKSLPPQVIRRACRKTALREIAQQKAEFRQFGIMADWMNEDHTYRTLDHSYEMRQLRIFKQMVDKGLIYRRYRPVYYSPSSRSALAEAELEYAPEHSSHSVYISFELVDIPSLHSLSAHKSVKLLAWTTTPWTLTANMAIVANPDVAYAVVKHTESDQVFIVAEERIRALSEGLGELYKVAIISGTELVGLQYKPLFPGPMQTMEVIPASYVTTDTGTGLVHCAPAHGAEDYAVWNAMRRDHDLICHVDADGKFSNETPHEGLVGKDVLQTGTEVVIGILRERGQLLKDQWIKHRYPYDWKTKQPVIVTATSQWFADLGDIKGNSLSALDDVQFTPSQSRNRLEAFIRLRSEWCISRQRVWGVPIPSLYRTPPHSTVEEAVLDSDSLDHILSLLDTKGTEYWWHGPVDEFIPPHLKNEPATWRKGTDTMDVWFDSGTSWSMLTGLEGQADRNHLADVCLEGSDQHRGWFQSQLLTKIATSGKTCSAPYETLITHGMVLDQQGKKMSKSLGNIVSPLSVVLGGKDKKAEPAYGADTLRLWAATVEYWHDMSIGPVVLSQTAETMRRIRNSVRFILGNANVAHNASIKTSRADLSLLDRYVLHELYKLEQTSLEMYATYNFPKVIQTLVNFANVTLSSLYFDVTKDCLYADPVDSKERRAVTMVLEQILSTMTSVYAPVLPHLAEEVHDYLRPRSGESFFTASWKPLDESFCDREAASDMRELLPVRSVVLGLLEKARARKDLKSSLEADVEIVLLSPDDASALLPPLVKVLEREKDLLKTLFITSDVRIVREDYATSSSAGWSYAETVDIPEYGAIIVQIRPAALSKCPRCWTYARPADAALCGRCEDVIGHSARS